MAEPFLSEIRLFSFNFAPRGWALCNGQFLPINQNQALFSLLGTTYGGNGQTNFALPDMRGRTPIHFGNNHVLGEQAGEAAHTLTLNEMPKHIHVVQASTALASTNTPANNLTLAASSGSNLYDPTVQLVQMAADALGNAGGSQAHQNMQPFLAINFCIALQGIFPSRN